MIRPPASTGDAALWYGELGWRIFPLAGKHPAIKGGRGTFSDFNRAAPVTEFVLLGNIATRLGRPLEYDPVAGKITNDEEANRWIMSPRRKGWEL